MKYNKVEYSIMPVDYSKGKIYQIVDYTNDNVYIGSTCEPTLARRLANHVIGYKAYLNGKGNYVTSYKILENDNYDIQLIEFFPCETKDELHKREGYHINRAIGCVNKIIAGRTRKESKTRKINCICGSTTDHDHKTRHEQTKKHKAFIEQQNDA
jgi:hypothetical protein